MTAKLLAQLWRSKSSRTGHPELSRSEKQGSKDTHKLQAFEAMKAGAKAGDLEVVPEDVAVNTNLEHRRLALDATADPSLGVATQIGKLSSPKQVEPESVQAAGVVEHQQVVGEILQLPPPVASSEIAGAERHRSIHLLDSTVVCTACRDGRKERTWQRSSSDRALSRSGAEPRAVRACLAAAASIARKAPSGTRPPPRPPPIRSPEEEAKPSHTEVSCLPAARKTSDSC